jgi:hypothetical protein
MEQMNKFIVFILISFIECPLLKAELLNNSIDSSCINLSKSLLKNDAYIPTPLIIDSIYFPISRTDFDAYQNKNTYYKSKIGGRLLIATKIWPYKLEIGLGTGFIAFLGKLGIDACTDKELNKSILMTSLFWAIGGFIFGGIYEQLDLKFIKNQCAITNKVPISLDSKLIIKDNSSSRYYLKEEAEVYYYNKIISYGDTNDYNFFFQNYPSSPLMESIELSLLNKNEYCLYFMKKYPYSKYLKEVFKCGCFDRIKPYYLDKYAADYPNSVYTIMIRYDEAIKANDLNTYSKFINTYPSSQYSEEINYKIATIKEDKQTCINYLKQYPKSEYSDSVNNILNMIKLIGLKQVHCKITQDNQECFVKYYADNGRGGRYIADGCEKPDIDERLIWNKVMTTFRSENDSTFIIYTYKLENYNLVHCNDIFPFLINNSTHYCVRGLFTKTCDQGKEMLIITENLEYDHSQRIIDKYKSLNEFKVIYKIHINDLNGIKVKLNDNIYELNMSN